MRARPPLAIGMFLAITMMVATCILVPASASAYWSVASTVPGSGGASAARVLQGDTPLVAVATQNDITVDWNPTTLSNGTAVSGYTVSRFSAGNVSQTMLAGCAGTITASICVETNVPDGLWTYTITPRFATNWAGAPSAKSAAVRSDATAPTNNISRTTVTGGSSLAAPTVYYRGAEAGSFRLVNTLADAGSGPASSSTSALGGTTTGWTHTPSSVATPAGGPFAHTFSWTAGTSSQPSVGVTGADNAGNTASTTFTFVPDSASPGGGAITYANGYSNAPTLAVTVGTISDTGSGVTPGGPRRIERSTSTLNGNTCASFGPWSSDVTDPAVAPTANNVAIEGGRCHQFRYVFTDNVGNQTIATSTSIVKARSYQAVIQAAGPINYWRLGDTGNTLDDIQPANNNGILGVQWSSAPGAISGDSNLSTSSLNGTSYAVVNRQIGDSFTIEFWFTSGGERNRSSDWFQAVGMIGTTARSPSEFGVSLNNVGQVVAGTGNTSGTSIASPAGVNLANNAWHHVAFTRAGGTGNLALYIDGTLSSSGSSPAGPLAAASTMNIARNANSNPFSGALDEMAMFTSVLTAAQISQHYSSGLP